MLSPPAQRVPESQVVGRPPEAVGILPGPGRTQQTGGMGTDSAPRTPTTRTRPASQTSPDGAEGSSPVLCPPTLPDSAATPTAPP
eukprot:10676736-Lingulodinium_polyedra.AAC.1